MLKTLLMLALLVPVSTAAMAQNDRGTEQEQKACSRDVTRHCRSVIDQGDLVVLACLKENRTKLSKACNQVLANHGQ